MNIDTISSLITSLNKLKLILKAQQKEIEEKDELIASLQLTNANLLHETKGIKEKDELIKELQATNVAIVKKLTKEAPKESEQDSISDVEKLKLNYTSCWRYLINRDTGLMFKEFEIDKKLVLVCIGAKDPESQGEIISLYADDSDQGLVDLLEKLGRNCGVKVIHLKDIYKKLSAKDRTEMRNQHLLNF